MSILVGMKKTFTISFLILYVILNAGVNILVHTCGAEADIFVATTTIEDPCGCADEMSPSDMCCTTTVTTVKLDDAQKTVIAVQPDNVTAIEYLPAIALSSFNIEHSLFVISSDTSPPAQKDFQASNSVFLI